MICNEYPFEKARLVQASPILTNTSFDSCLFLKYGKRQLFARDMAIVNPGDIINRLYYLHQGQIKMSVFTPLGMEKTYWIMNAPVLFGEALMYSNLPARCLLKAHETCEVYSIEENEMYSLAAQDPALMRSIFTSLARKLIILSSQVQDLCQNDSMFRVAKLLCTLAYQNGKETDGDKYVVKLRLTHQELANITGLHRVTVSKVLRKFSDRRIIDRQKNTIIIKDINQLKRLLA